MSQLCALSSQPLFLLSLLYTRLFFFLKRDSSHYTLLLFFFIHSLLTHSKLLSSQSSPLANDTSVPLIMFTEFLIFRLEKEALCCSAEFGSFNKIGSVVKNLPTVQEMQVHSLVWNNQKKGMATLSSILSWRILWTEDPGRLQSKGLQRVGHDWMTKQKQNNNYTHTHTYIYNFCMK